MRCVMQFHEAADWNAAPVDYNNHYQQTAAQYANSGPYTTGNTSTYIAEYGGAVNERPESPSEDKQAQHNMLSSSVAYLQAPYHDELSEFRITPSPGGAMLEHRFPDDPANMVYGYVSPYTTQNSAGKYHQTMCHFQLIFSQFTIFLYCLFYRISGPSQRICYRK